VRNLADGRVEGLACGAPQALQALRQWLHRGPAAARVDALSWEAEQTPPAEGFRVLR
jgi:acylphosphatase